MTGRFAFPKFAEKCIDEKGQRLQKPDQATTRGSCRLGGKEQIALAGRLVSLIDSSQLKSCGFGQHSEEEGSTWGLSVLPLLGLKQTHYSLGILQDAWSPAPPFSASAKLSAGWANSKDSTSTVASATARGAGTACHMAAGGCSRPQSVLARYP
ncbi:hypothetical protein [Arthrobacter sp. NPDC093139]|uniref:hypothetical protein n=1 Tax=Arthrobacter sp. NPDC093139 TaxID=3363945 RepID=UPI0037F73EA4